MTSKSLTTVAVERIEKSIVVVRGERIIRDADLAALYGVETRALLQAVKRNLQRFPKDFMFRLTKIEAESLRSQTVISKGRGGRRSLPYAFTEQGVAMLSSVLHNDRAVAVNVEIKLQKICVHLLSEPGAQRPGELLIPLTAIRNGK